MARIPEFQSEAQITTRAPATRETGGIFSSAVARETQRIGDTISRVAQRFEEARTLAETTRASNIAKRRLEELKLTASTTEDFTNTQQFTDGITKIREDASNTISLPLARQDFQRIYDRDALDAEFTIKNILRKRIVDDAKAQMLENIELIQNSSINRDAELSDLLSKNVRSGIIGQETAFNLKKKTLKNWQEVDIRDAIALDPDSAKDSLIKGEFGKLSASETSDWQDAADKQKKRNVEIAQKKRDEKWLVNGGELISNLEKTSVQDIIQMIARDDIDPDLGNDLIEWKTDPETVQYETDKKIWLEIARDSVSPEQDLRAFQNRIGKAVANKNIQAEDAANLSVQVKSLFDTAIKFKSKPDRFNQAIGAALDFFKTFPQSQGIDLIKNQFDLSRKFLRTIAEKNIKNPEEVSKVADDVINENIKTNFDWIKGLPEKGQIMIDKNGKKVKVFPDGRVEEVK